MGKDLKEVNKMLKNEEAEELANKSANLDVLLDKSYEIDKETFETYFLPYIIGNENSDESAAVFSYNYRKMTEGSFRVPLYVLDNDGSILYKLPPLFLGLDTEESGKVSFTKILNSFFMGIENGNINAGKIFNKNMNKTDKHIDKDKGVFEFYRGELQKIYIDYKYMIKNKDIKVPLDKENEIEDDFLEY